MKVNAWLVPILVIGALLGTVAVAQATGQWSTSGRTSVDLESFAPEEIKGWMTLQQISEGVRLPLTELYSLVGLPADLPPTTAVKELEALVPGFEVTTIRDALTAWQAGESSGPVGDEIAPLPALTATPVATVIAAPTEAPHTGGGQGLGDASGAGPTPLPAGQILAADQIKGRMTLGEVSAQCAVPLAALLQGLNLPAGTSADTKIKDLISQGAIGDVTTVQQVVTGLQAP